VQDRPTAAELLAEIADALEGDVLHALTGPLQHSVRVAGNLARIVQRELELGPAADAREHAALSVLLTSTRAEPAQRSKERTIEDLSAEVAARIRSGDVNFGREAWPVLVAIAKDKVAIVKPGHDSYDFADEQDT